MSKIVITYDSVEKTGSCLIDGKILENFCCAHMSIDDDYPYCEIISSEEDEENKMYMHHRITCSAKKEQKDN